MRIYTRRGDRGETDLLGGARVPKDHLRVDAYGAVDELNASLGVCAASTAHEDVRVLLSRLQRELFGLGAYLACAESGRREQSGVAAPDDSDVLALESAIDRYEQELSPLRHFVLPGGTPVAAALHVARTVCRRAERRCVALDRAEALHPTALRHLNRLSDLLFVLARLENARAGVPDAEWIGRSSGDPGAGATS